MGRLCERFLRHEEPSFALAFVDVEEFKSVNDGTGQLMGDEVLHAVAKRLVGAVGASDTVARFGGDEFAVLLDEVRDPSDAMVLATCMRDAVRLPWVLAGERVALSSSVGIVTSDAPFEEAADLVNHADEAMYAAKRKGNAVVLYSGSDILQTPTARIWLYDV